MASDRQGAIWLQHDVSWLGRSPREPGAESGLGVRALYAPFPPPLLVAVPQGTIHILMRFLLRLTATARGCTVIPTSRSRHVVSLSKSLEALPRLSVAALGVQ